MCFNVKASSAVSFDLMIRVTSLAITLVNHINKNTLATLKHVWNRDKATGTEPTSVNGFPIPKLILSCATHLRNIGNMASTHATPNKLNRKWAKAALLAVVLATMAAKFAVIVVPMFSPKTMEAAISNPIHPLAHMTSVNAIVAEEDWIRIVRAVPISMNSM